MLQPRWKKILGDLWSNKTRTLLVVLSIFIGVFAIGVIVNARHVLSRELDRQYASSKPAHATISVPAGDDFGDDLLQSIRNMDAVAEAEGRRTLNVRVRTGLKTWQNLRLIALDDYQAQDISIVQTVRGPLPPPEDTVLIERSGYPPGGATIGDRLLIEQPDGTQETLQVAGIVHDLTREPTFFSGTIYGYVTRDTLQSLGEPRTFNKLLLRLTGNTSSKAHNKRVAEEVWERLKDSGRDPAFPIIPDPGSPPTAFLITGLTLLLSVLGGLAIILSGFLVTNTISALLRQQSQHIGVMKTFGARTPQIVGMYMVLVLCFGLIALLPAIPASRFVARLFTSYVADFLNFDLTNFAPPAYTVIIQTAISIIVPMLAALVPVLSGAQVSVREALEGQQQRYGTRLLDRLMRRIRGLPRPTLLSLRNTFRRKKRLLLTLLTLTIGGAIFIAIFSVQNSVLLTLNNVSQSLFNYDVEVMLDRPHTTSRVKQAARQVEGVVAVENWNFTRVRRVLSDDSQGDTINLFAVPATTEMMNPRILRGRWLTAGDENALVLSSGIVEDDPTIALGDNLTISIKGEEATWQVVGVMQAIGPARFAYVNSPYYRRVTGAVGETDNLVITTKQHTLHYQSTIASTLEAHFKQQGIEVASTSTTKQQQQQYEAQFRFVIVGMLIMAVLIAVVGGIGLTGTMSLNVLERTREIGVMRAIGATARSITSIVLTEGIVIGAISWLLGTLLSLPISRMLSSAVGNVLFNFPLDFRFSLLGMTLWLLISVILSALASALPAWNATQVSVREALAYE
jgi:putative ABC transport system permease protein